MTWKKFWRRVNALLHDNRTVLREGEDIEDWEEVQRKQREIEAEQRKPAKKSQQEKAKKSNFFQGKKSITKRAEKQEIFSPLAKSEGNS